LTMDIQSNEKEQLEVSDSILKIWDSCPEEGELSKNQYFEVGNLAYRLAELITNANEWNRKKRT